VFTHVFSGGRDSYIDETDQTNLNTLMQSNTPGVVYDWQSTLNAYAPGDTIPIISRAYGVGTSAGQNEGLDYHLRLGETDTVFEGTLSGAPSCGVTCTFAVTQTMGVAGGIGAGVPLIDINNGYNTGYIASFSNNFVLTGSGTNWTSVNSTTPTSSITTTTANIDNGSATLNTFPQTNVQVNRCGAHCLGLHQNSQSRQQQRQTQLQPGLHPSTRAQQALIHRELHLHLFLFPSDDRGERPYASPLRIHNFASLTRTFFDWNRSHK
jgi:hypothetical protein